MESKIVSGDEEGEHNVLNLFPNKPNGSSWSQTNVQSQEQQSRNGVAGSL